jgi:hypothetical protein
LTGAPAAASAATAGGPPPLWPGRAMPTEIYLWKWAANDLPGDPAAVVEELWQGGLPACLERFLLRRVYSRLTRVLDSYRADLSEILVDPDLRGGAARFIRFRHPFGDAGEFARQLLWAGWPAELTVYDATARRLIGLPKRNLVEWPDGRQLVDITGADAPALLAQLARAPGLAALTCYDRAGNMFQVWAHQRRYAVEWQVLPIRDFNLHRIWVAGRPGVAARRARLGSLERGLDLYARELLTLPEVYGLWLAFLAGAGANRPLTHQWRDITRQLDHPDQPRRYRHLQSSRRATAGIFSAN